MTVTTPKSTSGIVIEILTALSSPSAQMVPRSIPIKRSTNQTNNGIPRAKSRSRRSQSHTRSWLKMTKINGMDRPADMLTTNGQQVLCEEKFLLTHVREHVVEIEFPILIYGKHVDINGKKGCHK